MKTRGTRAFCVATMAAVVAVLAHGTGGAEAAVTMPQAWDFGTDPGKDNLDDFDLHLRDWSNPEIALTSDGVDMQRRVAISTEFDNVGAGANADFTVRALADWTTDSNRDFNRIGIGMLGTETGDDALIWDGDYLVFGVMDGDGGSSVGGYQSLTRTAITFGVNLRHGTPGTEVGDLTGIIPSGKVSNDGRLVDLLVNAVYDEGLGTITFDWTVTLVDEDDPSNTASVSSSDPGHTSYTVDIADFDGPRFGFAYDGHSGDGGPGVNLKEFEVLDVPVVVIPEPGALALLALGGLAFLVRRRRRR